VVHGRVPPAQPQGILIALGGMATTSACTGNALFLMALFKGRLGVEKSHPLEVGFVRLNFRRDRRRPVDLFL
jgi:hypothetical protein